MAVAPPPPAYSSNPQFFVDNKKGELNEIRQLLKSVPNEKDQNKRRDVIKKVIAYMTLGIDVSKVYTDMVLISKTNDIVQKKMIYLYLVNYAESNEEVALMAVNTFNMDCEPLPGSDPKIRGLALRNLCSLRFTGAFEYILPAITKALSDVDAYVKRTAIIGLIKLYRTSKDLIRDSNFVEQLYELIKDPEPIVSANAIIALNEILEEEGGIAVSRKMVVYLLNRVTQYNEFGQSVIFDLAVRYKPKEEELYDILNILEDRLKHSSSAVVLGCIKAFLVYTAGDERLTQQVYSRILAPLLTLYTSGGVAGAHELSFTVLSHIHLLIQRGAASVFENEFKHFFCKYNEPQYIKVLKIDILTMISTENNLHEILMELSEYVTDVDAELSRRAIRAIGNIAMRLPNVSSNIIRQLLDFLRLNSDYTITETLITMKDILRKYSQHVNDILGTIETIIDKVQDPDGKAAVIWMMGEFGEMIPQAPYILEDFIKNLKDIQSPSITYALLTASVKLFLKRAPEMQAMLGSLFQQIFNESDNPDLKDRAGFYYKILRNPQLAHEIINVEKGVISDFSEESRASAIEEICQEFNTLSVPYQKPSKKFIKKEFIINPEMHRPEPTFAPPVPAAAAQATTDLLTLDEAPPRNELPDLSTIPPPDSTLPTMTSNIELTPNAVVAAEQFQAMWVGIEDSVMGSLFLNSTEIPSSAIEGLMNEKRIYTMATSEDGPMYRFYFFAMIAPSQTVVLVEMNVDLTTRELSFSIKCQDQSVCRDFSNYLKIALHPILI